VTKKIEKPTDPTEKNEEQRVLINSCWVLDKKEVILRAQKIFSLQKRSESERERIESFRDGSWGLGLVSVLGQKSVFIDGRSKSNLCIIEQQLQKFWGLLSTTGQQIPF